MRTWAIALALAGLAAPATAIAADPPEAIVSIYRAAPGKQLALLQWFAAQDAAAKAVGLPTGILYAHKSGASWDYVWITPQNTAAQDKALDAELTKRGMMTGPKMGLQLRELIAEHSDTLSVGPMTAAEAAAADK